MQSINACNNSSYEDTLSLVQFCNLLLLLKLNVVMKYGIESCPCILGTLGFEHPSAYDIFDLNQTPWVIKNVGA